MLTRQRTAILWLLVIGLLAFNSFAVPLFLYGAFGTDANIGLSLTSWMMHALLMLWVFVIAPNMPLIGMLVSVLHQDSGEFQHHLYAFLGVLLGGLCYYLGNTSTYMLFALLFTQVFGIVSIAFLIHKYGMFPGK